MNSGRTLTLQTDILRAIEIVVRRIRLRLYWSQKLNHALCTARTSADTKRITRLRRAIATTHFREPFSAAKYVDFPIWLLRNMHRAAQLGLHKASGLRILDIGAGPGYFIAAARALGHECRGIDVPDSWFTPLERQVYSELLEALNCRQYVSPVSVERFVPLPFNAGEFDLITAFLICFNRHDKPDQWGVPEWRFFVEDALQMLRPGGRVLLGLNDNRKRYGKLLFYNDALLDYFQSVGTVEGARITIVNKQSSAQNLPLAGSNLFTAAHSS